MAELRSLLTPRLQRRADDLLTRLQQERRWDGDLPVLLLNRCWLQLEVVAVGELTRRLPPDCSAEAPELRRYRDLLNHGCSDLRAQETCWQEFGREACGEALRRFWSQQERGNRGWTLEAYLQLVRDYRRLLEQPGPTPLPLLVLGRSDSQESHQLRWCWPAPPAMRHTCR
jgi:hypothetical protein